MHVSQLTQNYTCLENIHIYMFIAHCIGRCYFVNTSCFPLILEKKIQLVPKSCCFELIFSVLDFV